ncbi:hypothetical protein CPSG_01931 [Coccidioides posadasii str. Silveira]|uniref:Uncharacterized protein n=1 Tax=Coccidioides posadasii (strain RMSCC 757 / Silveira) TaxID=443226 RepID=E9CWU8_COCPS|nr:hypothetical protein CPSG_10027 [Coccidioides posadasii str. Silveira]EFW14285.1 hypothetical protein CPSG_09136 [Coccidioides posadasii str. Silveira]EFW16568.1 hypothetical protein CPSG_07084 [Coccidioides posadasii str. Silveira]EFW19824.1 hypothetical protein CPSG_02999 [Coccidioides posadasii str. Silveira]EFW21773.1 hypothetical protein CPSG_01931 [Coccidioides posadasii str. Silveira]
MSTATGGDTHAGCLYRQAVSNAEAYTSKNLRCSTNDRGATTTYEKPLRWPYASESEASGGGDSVTNVDLDQPSIGRRRMFRGIHVTPTLNV